MTFEEWWELDIMDYPVSRYDKAERAWQAATLAERERQQQEIDRLREALTRYEQHGVTCQTYRHSVDGPCVECNCCFKAMREQK